MPPPSKGDFLFKSEGYDPRGASMFRVDCEEIAASVQQVLQHLLHLIKLGTCKIFYQLSRDTDAASLVLYSCNCAIFGVFYEAGRWRFSKLIRFHWKLAGLRACQPFRCAKVSSKAFAIRQKMFVTQTNSYFMVSVVLSGPLE